MMPTEEAPSTYLLLKTVVEPNCSMVFTLNFPHEKGPFRPTSFNVPADVAPHFTITDIKAGMNSQLVASISCVPATIFSPADPEDDLYFDLVPPALNLAITVTNTSRSR